MNRLLCVCPSCSLSRISYYYILLCIGKSLHLSSCSAISRVLHTTLLFFVYFLYLFSLTIAPKESFLTYVIRTVYFDEHLSNDVDIYEICYCLSLEAEAIHALGAEPRLQEHASSGSRLQQVWDADEQDINKPLILQIKQLGGASPSNICWGVVLKKKKKKRK